MDQIEHEVGLRPFIASDHIAIAQMLNNKKIWDNLRDYIPHPYHLEDAIKFIEHTQNEDPKLTFAIEYKNICCGVIGLIQLTDIYRNTAEIGYWIGESFWNKGIATQAVKLMTTYGLNQLGIFRIHAGIIEYNKPSMKALEKNGYILEGIFKKGITKNEKLWDEYRYARLKPV